MRRFALISRILTLQCAAVLPGTDHPWLFAGLCLAGACLFQPLNAWHHRSNPTMLLNSWQSVPPEPAPRRPQSVVC